MKVPSCGVTFVLLHVGHLIRAFSFSEMVMVSSNGFRHFSHMNSYLGMVILPDQSSSRRAHSAWRFKIRLHRVGIEVAGPAGTNALAPRPLLTAPGPGALHRVGGRALELSVPPRLHPLDASCGLTHGLR
jgi:hypothetical protein